MYRKIAHSKRTCTNKKMRAAVIKVDLLIQSNWLLTYQSVRVSASMQQKQINDDDGIQLCVCNTEWMLYSKKCLVYLDERLKSWRLLVSWLALREIYHRWIEWNACFFWDTYTTTKLAHTHRQQLSLIDKSKHLMPHAKQKKVSCETNHKVC